jgi:hypothetical protein
MGSSVYSMDEALHKSARNPTRATTVEYHPSKTKGGAPAPCKNRKERATPG